MSTTKITELPEVYLITFSLVSVVAYKLLKNIRCNMCVTVFSKYSSKQIGTRLERRIDHE